MYVKLYITRLLIWFSLKEMSVMSTSKMFCSKFMRVTPPSPLAYCVPPYFGLAYCVPLFLASHTVYCLTTKNNHFGCFIYIKKKINDCMSHARVQSFLKTLALMCLLVICHRCWTPQINVQVYKCWNDPHKIASEARAQKIDYFFAICLCISRVLCFCTATYLHCH